MGNKKEIVNVTAAPTQNPLATPPLTKPNNITQFGVVDTSNSSKLLLYFVIKNEDTVFAYDCIITVIKMIPGTMKSR